MLASLGLPGFGRKHGLHDISQELDGPEEGVLRVRAFLQNRWYQPGHGSAPLENGNGFACPLDFIEDGQTLRFELGSPDRSHVTTLGDHMRFVKTRGVSRVRRLRSKGERFPSVYRRRHLRWLRPSSSGRHPPCLRDVRFRWGDVPQRSADTRRRRAETVRDGERLPNVKDGSPPPQAARERRPPCRPSARRSLPAGRTARRCDSALRSPPPGSR